MNYNKINAHAFVFSNVRCLTPKVPLKIWSWGGSGWLGVEEIEIQVLVVEINFTVPFGLYGLLQGEFWVGQWGEF